MTKDCFKLYVHCITFNHARYIKDTMDGFCMQQTNFPYVCIIVDDASTDGEQDVIRSYLEQHFVLNDEKNVRRVETEDYVMTFVQHRNNLNCFFAVYLLKYNHYSVHKSKIKYITEFLESVDYCALCEGDDYWTDPHKLQIQFDYMESHSECTMTCHRAQLFSENKKKIVGEQYCRTSDGILNPVDIINRTGLYIPTCSIVYRTEIKNYYPEYCNNCNVGDYPLQISAAMKGTVYYFDRIMSVYRIENSFSWEGRQKFNSIDSDRLHIVKSQMEMFKGFSNDYPKYSRTFRDKISEHIIKNIPFGYKSDDIHFYTDVFQREISEFSFIRKCVLSIYKYPIRIIRRIIRKLFFGKYYQLRKFYYFI